MADENNNSNNSKENNNNYSKWTFEDTVKVAVTGIFAVSCIYGCFDYVRSAYLKRHPEILQYVNSNFQEDTSSGLVKKLKK